MDTLLISNSSTTKRLDEIYALVAKRSKPDVVTLHEHKIIDGQAKRVVATFDPKTYKTIELLMITDVQLGAVECKEDRVIEFRDWVLDKPNRFVFFGGDMIDAATKMSIASCYQNKWNPSKQIFKIAEMLAPLRHRVLGYVSGNHEARTSKVDIDAGEWIASLLRIPWSSGKQLIDVHFGEHKPFKVDLWHGRGSASTKGAKAQMLSRFMHQGDSQLYLCGHLHDVLLLFDWRQKRTSNDIRLEKIAGVMSSSFLDYWGSYAEVAGLPPSDTMMARAILEPDGHWEVTLR